MQRKYCSSGNKSLTLVILGQPLQTQNEVDRVIDESKYNDEERNKFWVQTFIKDGNGVIINSLCYLLFWRHWRFMVSIKIFIG